MAAVFRRHGCIATADVAAGRRKVLRGLHGEAAAFTHYWTPPVVPIVIDSSDDANDSSDDGDSSVSTSSSGDSNSETEV
jgi:hypothetical protein